MSMQLGSFRSRMNQRQLVRRAVRIARRLKMQRRRHVARIVEARDGQRFWGAWIKEWLGRGKRRGHVSA